MKQINQTSESGRSMVEMLGILSIMGVLSAGAIGGYHMALNKYYANEIIRGVSARAMSIGITNLASGATTLAGFENMILKYPVRLEEGFEGDSSRFLITVESVPQAVCEKVIRDKPENCLFVYGGSADEAIRNICIDGDNTIIFEFNNSLSQTLRPNDFNGNKEECEKNPDLKYCISNNTCISSNEKCQCSKYDINECGTGYYCRFNDKLEGEKDFGGKCEALLTSRKISLNLGSDNTKTLYAYGNRTQETSLNWYSATNICISTGHHMIEPSDVGIKNLTSCSNQNCSIICGCGENGKYCSTEINGCQNGTCNCWIYLKNAGLQGYYWTNRNVEFSALNIGIFDHTVTSQRKSQSSAYVGYQQSLCK